MIANLLIMVIIGGYETIFWKVVIQVVFILSALGLAWIDKTGHPQVPSRAEPTAGTAERAGPAPGRVVPSPYARPETSGGTS